MGACSFKFCAGLVSICATKIIMALRIKLGTKIWLSFFIVTLVTGLGMGWFIYFIESQNFERHITDDLLILAEAQDAAISSFWDKEKSRVADFASDGFIRDSLADMISGGGSITAKELTDYIVKNKLSLDKDIFEIEIIDKKGIVRAAVNTEEIGENYSDLPVFKTTLSLPYGQVYINRAEMYQDVGFGEVVPAMTFAAPLTDKNTGETIGVLDTRVNLLVLKDLLQKYVLDEGARAYFKGQTTLDTYLAGPDGVILTQPDNTASDIVLNRSVPDTMIGKCHFAGRSRNYAGQDVYVSTECSDDGYIVFAEIGADEVSQNMQSLRGKILYLALIMTCLVVVLAFIFVKRIIYPLKRLTIVAKKIGKGDLSQRVYVKSKDEIGDLADEINKMSDELGAFHRSLENKVEEKTRALSESVEKLSVKNKELESAKNEIASLAENLSVKNETEDAYLQSIGEGVVATDKDGAVVFINKYAEKLLELASGEAIGKEHHNLWKLQDSKTEKILPEDEMPCQRCIKTKQRIESGDYRMVTKRKVFDVFLITTPILIEDKYVGNVMVIRDVTEQKKIDHTKSEFIALASHQLRTPLTAMRWLLESLASGEQGKLTKKQEKIFKELHQSTLRMVELVGVLLDVSKIEMGTFIMEKESLDVKTFIKSIVKDYEEIFKEKKLALKEKYEDGLSSIYLDKKILKIILQNLLSNAARYISNGGTITVGAEKNKEGIVVNVSDTGWGIPEDEQLNIFTRFYRGANVKTKDPAGTGLGLYLTKEAVESFGGRIWFESEEKKGTNFHILLPVGLFKKDKA